MITFTQDQQRHRPLHPPRVRYRHHAGHLQDENADGDSYLSIHPSAYLYIHPSIYLYIHSSIHPSIYMLTLTRANTSLFNPSKRPHEHPYLGNSYTFTPLSACMCVFTTAPARPEVRKCGSPCPRKRSTRLPTWWGPAANARVLRWKDVTRYTWRFELKIAGNVYNHES